MREEACDWMTGVVSLDGRDGLLAVSCDLNSGQSSVAS